MSSAGLTAGRRKIVIRGRDGSKRFKMVKDPDLPKTKDMKMNRNGIVAVSKPKRKQRPNAMVKFLQDMTVFDDMPEYLRKFKMRSTKIEQEVIKQLIARLLVAGATRPQIAKIVGTNTARINIYIRSKGFNRFLEDAKEDVFEDLEKPLKLIYSRAVNRLQDILANPDDLVAIKACEIIMKTATMSFDGNKKDNNNEGANIFNSGKNVKLTRKAREAGLTYLKEKKRQIKIRKSV